MEKYGGIAAYDGLREEQAIAATVRAGSSTPILQRLLPLSPFVLPGNVIVRFTLGPASRVDRCEARGEKPSVGG